MFDCEKESKTLSPRERELVVAYLSYALEDVRALSPMGSHFLQMTIASIAEETQPGHAGPAAAIDGFALKG